ncbi:hypothetical protein OEZ85_009209 [Tetradesmus obliquus]|uniref:Uncharacterized protein n=1 Tax=Tetradesmus obliquus TaxID=3088 RepID=A0ABY8U896_TETOB|nr:hypothetical protein OEZ85_009209 [Tetradesmus obliquus]
MLAVRKYAAGDDELQLALAVQAIAEAAQLGTGSAELLFPQTLDEYYAACEEEQPWKAIAEAAQLGTGSAELLFPQTLDEYCAACEEEQPWKVAL